MRSSPLSIAALIALSVFLPVAGAVAEGADFDDTETDGSQIKPAGAEPYVPKAGNLYTVPEDGALFNSSAGMDSPMVKQILASRPNEDVVICIAGCYSGANRVVYAQPSAAAMRGTVSSQPAAPTRPQKQSALEKAKRSAAIDPRTPVIINPSN